MPPVERTTIDTADLEFAALTCTPEGVDAFEDADRHALCFHGFPDDPGSMEPLMERLADAGYATVAPWMRGYGETDRPPVEPGNYTPFSLASDVLALIGALGADDPLLVGHDWGAIAVTAASVADPDSIGHAVVMAVPPNFSEALDDHASQALRSWYMTEFQIPGHGEEILRRDDFALIERLWRLWSPGLSAEDRIEAVKETFRTGETVEASLMYYRDFFDEFMSRPGSARAVRGIDVRTLLLAGRQDGCIGVDLFADATECYDARATLETLPRAGHFLHLEAPDQVADHVLEFVDG